MRRDICEQGTGLGKNLCGTHVGNGFVLLKSHDLDTFEYLLIYFSNVVAIVSPSVRRYRVKLAKIREVTTNVGNK